MIDIKVEIPESVHEISGFQIANLSYHEGQQRIGSNVERYPKEEIRTPLIELATQSTLSNVELEQDVAGRQCHLVDFGNIPGAHDVTSAGWIVADGIDDLGNLVVEHPIRSFP